MSENMETSLDLMITLKDALEYYGKYLEERIQLCATTSENISGYMKKIENTVDQEAVLIQEIGSLGEQISTEHERTHSI